MPIAEQGLGDDTKTPSSSDIAQDVNLATPGQDTFLNQTRPNITDYRPTGVEPQQAAISGDGRMDFVTAGDRGQEFAKAAKHTSRVRQLKILLPVVAVLILAMIGATFVVQQLLTPTINLGNIIYDDGKLVMENPKLKGVDQKQRPYSLSAQKAVQDAADPTKVELVEVNATLPVDSEGSADIFAGNALYDAEAKTLKLRQSVVLSTATGITVAFDQADVDVDKGWMRTNAPISASSPEADLKADNLFVEDGGKRMVFEGNVKMTLRPKQMRERKNKLQVTQ